MKTKQAPRGAMMDRQCKCCELTFSARVADVSRGWALFCSKKCKAVDQEGRTQQYRKFLKTQAPTDGLSEAERDFGDDLFYSARAG